MIILIQTYKVLASAGTLKCFKRNIIFFVILELV